MLVLPEEFARYCDDQTRLAHGGATVAEAVAGLAARFPELAKRLLDQQGRLMPHLVVLHEGEVVAPEQTVNRRVGPTDTLEIYTAASGG